MRKKLMQFLSLIMYFLILIAIIKVKKFNDNLVSTLNKYKDIDFNITAESCIVMNQETKEVLYALNENKVMLPASITKILTCLTALSLFNEDDYVYITDKMINTVGSKMYLQNGDFVQVSTLLYGLMLQSGNDAAMALALNYSSNEDDFINEMNKLAKKLGMNKSTFKNSTGLDEVTKNYTTAYDMALLTSNAVNDERFLKYFGTKKITITEQNHTFYMYHKHRLVQNDESVIGGKTGYTRLAKRTLVTAFSENETTLIIVTLNAYNDWELHKKLFKHFLLDSRESSKTLLTAFERNFQ